MRDARRRERAAEGLLLLIKQRILVTADVVGVAWNEASVPVQM